MTTVDYFPANFANKEWVDAIVSSKKVALYEKLLILAGATSSDEKVVIGQNKNGQDNNEKIKEYARGKYRDLILSNQYKNHINAQLESFFSSDMMADRSIKDTLTSLPFGSWGIEFEFELKKPYISKDDEPFYIIDNPVRKDKVFKMPIVASSQWKGCLHAVMARDVAEETKTGPFIYKRIQLIKMFGPEQKNIADFFDKSQPGASDEFKKQTKKQLGVAKTDKYSRMGRLRFFPSFFNDIGLEIINPHDRVGKVGKNPIYIEAVPIGACAAFRLLYVPFDIMGRNRKAIEIEALMDLTVIINSIAALLTVYGVGAKISSGFGLAINRTNKGCFAAKGIQLTQNRQQKPSEAPQVPESVKAFWESHPDEDQKFTKKAKEWSQNKKRRNEYKKAKDKYQDYIRKKQQHVDAVKRFEEQASISNNEELTFKSIAEMKDVLVGPARNSAEDSHGHIY